LTKLITKQTHSSGRCDLDYNFWVERKDNGESIKDYQLVSYFYKSFDPEYAIENKLDFFDGAYLSRDGFYISYKKRTDIKTIYGEEIETHSEYCEGATLMNLSKVLGLLLIYLVQV